MAYSINNASNNHSFNILDGELNGPNTFPTNTPKYNNLLNIERLNSLTSELYVAGNHVTRFDNATFDIINSSDNAGSYNSVSATFDGIITTITVAEALSDSTGLLGDIRYETPSNEIETTLTFFGKYSKLFVEYLNENFVNLLEHFASDVEPPNPIKGQLWYDTSTSLMKIFNSVTFTDINNGGFLTQTSADAAYLAKAGGTMNGSLRVPRIAFNTNDYIFVDNSNPNVVSNMHVILDNADAMIFNADRSITINYPTFNDFDVITDAPNIVWDTLSSQFGMVTLTDNRTIDNPVTIKNGATYYLVIKQDSFGNKTLTFDSSYIFKTLPVLTIAANAIDLVVFHAHEDKLYGTLYNNYS